MGGNGFGKARAWVEGERARAKIQNSVYSTKIGRHKTGNRRGERCTSESQREYGCGALEGCSFPLFPVLAWMAFGTKIKNRKVNWVAEGRSHEQQPLHREILTESS